MSGNVNAEGYAATRQTLEPDVTAIAAPVRNADGSIIAAINLTGPSYRISDADMVRFGRAVVGAAAAIAKDIGGGFAER
jgi:DNA-binding IclR family transcriptional regulator